jgi:outer membrane protein assembly factor BamB
MIPSKFGSRAMAHLCRIVCGAFLVVTAGRLHAADWPSFRGPHGSGASEEARIADTLKIRWSVPLQGRGLSSPVISGGKLFITSATGPSQEQLRLSCLDGENGKLIWERHLKATGRTMAHPKTSVAANTPCTDGKRIYALWSSNDLAAFDQNGDLLWIRGLTEDYSNASNSLGMASSPILAGDTLVVMIENDSESYSLGVDAKTGRNRWKLERPKAANWTSPAIVPNSSGKNPDVILQSTKLVTAVDSVSGKIHWELPMNASSMSSPVVAGNVAYVASSGITALRLPSHGQQPETVWNSRQMNPATVSPLLLGSSLLSMNAAGVLMKASLTHGDILWKLRLTGPFSGSPVGAGERVLVVNEKGLVQIINTAAPEGAVLSQFQLPLKEESKELILSTPALSGEQVFVRSDSTLWCLAP